jgi:hypothetical protein
MGCAIVTHDSGAESDNDDPRLKEYGRGVAVHTAPGELGLCFLASFHLLTGKFQGHLVVARPLVLLLRLVPPPAPAPLQPRTLGR